MCNQDSSANYSSLVQHIWYGTTDIFFDSMAVSMLPDVFQKARILMTKYSAHNRRFRSLIPGSASCHFMSCCSCPLSWKNNFICNSKGQPRQFYVTLNSLRITLRAHVFVECSATCTIIFTIMLFCQSDQQEYSSPETTENQAFKRYHLFLKSKSVHFQVEGMQLLEIQGKLNFLLMLLISCWIFISA